MSSTTKTTPLPHPDAKGSARPSPGYLTVCAVVYHDKAFYVAHLILVGPLRANFARVGAGVAPKCPHWAWRALRLAEPLSGSRHWQPDNGSTVREFSMSSEIGVRRTTQKSYTSSKCDDARTSRIIFQMGLSLLRVNAVVTHVAKRSRRAWRARRVGVAICRVKRPRGAADAGRRIGLPIRPEPDRAGGPLPARRALHEGWMRNRVRIMGTRSRCWSGTCHGVWRAVRIAGIIDPCGEVLDLQLQAVWFPCFCIR